MTAGAMGWVTATAAAGLEVRAKAGVTNALAMAVATAAGREAGVGLGDSGGNSCSKGGGYPCNARSLRCPHVPTRGQQQRWQVCPGDQQQDDHKFVTARIGFSVDPDLHEKLLGRIGSRW